jgi:hypothetical protein
MEIVNGNPKKDGLYVAYLAPKAVGMHIAKMKVLLFHGGEWRNPNSGKKCSGNVLAHCGPLNTSIVTGVLPWE